jgi:hypothetical protein
VGVQELPQPLAADPDDPPVVAAQIGGEFADAPVGERAAQRLGPGLGRRDDERDIVVTDPAGTAARPLRVQRGQPPLVERVDHIPHGVLIGGHRQAVSGTVVPEAEPMTISARRTRIDPCLPRLTRRNRY